MLDLPIYATEVTTLFVNIIIEHTDVFASS